MEEIKFQHFNISENNIMNLELHKVPELQVKKVTFILFNNHGYKLEVGELIYHDTIRKVLLALPTKARILCLDSL